MTRPTYTHTQVTSAWRGHTMIDRKGDKVGSIADLYADTKTGKPEWALVHTGLFGTKATFVPLAGARFKGEAVQVPYGTSTIKDAPRIDPDGLLSYAEEAQLYSHYGLDYSDYSDMPSASGVTDTDSETSPAGRDDAMTRSEERDDAMTRSEERDDAMTRSEERDDAMTRSEERDDAMTRSEEELRVGTAQRERGRARLRKWVETEAVQQSVPLRRERARIEREPITEANIDQAMAGPDITQSEHEVILHEEEPMVEKRTVPKERVRLTKETATDQEQVSDDLRRERIDTEYDDPHG